MVVAPAGSGRVTWVQAVSPLQVVASSVPLMTRKSLSKLDSLLVRSQKVRVEARSSVRLSVARDRWLSAIVPDFIAEVPLWGATVLRAQGVAPCMRKAVRSAALSKP